MAQKDPFLKIGPKTKWSQICQKNKFNPLQIFKTKIMAHKDPFLKIGPKTKWSRISQKNKFNPL